MRIGKTIATIRKERDLKQFELAIKSGISKSFLSEIESNKKKPDLDTMEKICNALDVPLDIFMFKAINEKDIDDPEKRRLIREIKPLINRIADRLYSQSYHSLEEKA